MSGHALNYTIAEQGIQEDTWWIESPYFAAISWAARAWQQKILSAGITPRGSSMPAKCGYGPVQGLARQPELLLHCSRKSCMLTGLAVPQIMCPACTGRALLPTSIVSKAPLAEGVLSTMERRREITGFLSAALQCVDLPLVSLQIYLPMVSLTNSDCQSSRSSPSCQLVLSENLDVRQLCRLKISTSYILG